MSYIYISVFFVVLIRIPRESHKFSVVLLKSDNLSLLPEAWNFFLCVSSSYVSASACLKAIMKALRLSLRCLREALKANSRYIHSLGAIILAGEIVVLYTYHLRTRQTLHISGTWNFVDVAQRKGIFSNHLLLHCQRSLSLIYLFTIVTFTML